MRAWELYRELGEIIRDDPEAAGLEVFIPHPTRDSERYVAEVSSVRSGRAPGFKEVPEGGVLRSVSDGVFLS